MRTARPFRSCGRDLRNDRDRAVLGLADRQMRSCDETRSLFWAGRRTSSRRGSFTQLREIRSKLKDDLADDCGHYQCARTTDSTVVMPATIEPAIAIAAGMPRGSSRLTMAAMNMAAAGSAITK
jgi:hypothetical protein